MSAHPTWLIANWKMNGNAQSVAAWAKAVNAHMVGQSAHLCAVFCPPSIYLGDASAALPANPSLQLGAQNCHEQGQGPFTGAISALMLAEKGCRYVIVGHSECRMNGECDAKVAAKAHAAIAAGLAPVICVGESLMQYEAKLTLRHLDAQLRQLHGLAPSSYLIAYEPLWAIGSGHTPSTHEIKAAHSHIKSVLGSSANVLYGGSVNTGNVSEILALPEVSGALVGGASLDIQSMCALITSAASAT